MIKGLSARVVLTVAVLGAVVAGCTAEGNPRPADTGSTSAEQTSETTSPKPSTGGDSLADFDECEVLKSLATSLNLTDVETGIGGTCGANVSSTVSVSIKAHPDLGVGDVVPGGEQSDIEVNSRKAKLVKGSTSEASCLIAIEVTPKSRVDVSTSANASQAEACDGATKVAEAIEPKLPK